MGRSRYSSDRSSVDWAFRANARSSKACLEASVSANASSRAVVPMTSLAASVPMARFSTRWYRVASCQSLPNSAISRRARALSVFSSCLRITPSSTARRDRSRSMRRSMGPVTSTFRTWATPGSNSCPTWAVVYDRAGLNQFAHGGLKRYAIGPQVPQPLFPPVRLLLGDLVERGPGDPVVCERGGQVLAPETPDIQGLGNSLGDFLGPGDSVVNHDDRHGSPPFRWQPHVEHGSGHSLSILQVGD